MADPITLIPSNQTVELMRDSDGAVLGYGFGVPGVAENGEADQVQRWILKSSNPKDFFPHVATILRRPRDTRWQNTALADFLALVGWMFDRTRDCYVKVNCKRAPAAAIIDEAALTAPAFLSPEPGGGLQSDVGTCPIQRQGLAGWVWTTPGDNANKRVEHWGFYPGYSPSWAADERGIFLGNSDKPADFAALLNGKTWSESCTLLVASCGYYPGKLPEVL